MDALIYCRVSSPTQVKDGNGLGSQEGRCRIFADQKGYKVERVFPDEGVSGGLFERPAMRRLIDYLDNHDDRKFVIIFDDLARFARDLEVHLKLKTELVGRGAKLECLNFNFDDSPEGEFVENVIASANQLSRKQNTRQVIQKMKARLEQGYWPFCMPPGLKFAKAIGGGKILIPNEPFASIYREAIHKYSEGFLNTYEETRQYILGKYAENGITRKLSISGVNKILTEILYTGWVEYEKWEIELRKGKHEGFIDISTYQVVQDKIKRRTKAQVRQDYNPDFPLRGFILCSSCERPVTASWSRGRIEKYPFYHCKQSVCPLYGKTIRRLDLEMAFTGLIERYRPNSDTLNLARHIFTKVWDFNVNNESNQLESIQKAFDDIEAMIKQLVISATQSADTDLKIEYEAEITRLLPNKKELANKLKVNKNYSQERLGTASKAIFSYLENPVLMWQSANYHDKRTLLEMYFDEKLMYDRNEGFGTITLACLPKLLCFKEATENYLVEMAGVEPA